MARPKHSISVEELIMALECFHKEASVAVVIPENAEPGETYLIEGVSPGWDHERTGEFPIQLHLAHDPAAG